jgi:hypothetical protein
MVELRAGMKISRILAWTLKAFGFLLRWESVEGEKGKEGEREEEKEMVLLLMGILERKGDEAIWLKRD